MNVTIELNTLDSPQTFEALYEFIAAVRREAAEKRAEAKNASTIVDATPVEQKAEDAVAAGAALAAGLQAGIKAEDAPTVAAAKTGAEKAFEKAVTKAELRSAALKVSKAGKSEELAKLFKSFGANKLSEIAEADYAAVLEGLVKLNA